MEIFDAGLKRSPLATFRRAEVGVSLGGWPGEKVRYSSIRGVKLGCVGFRRKKEKDMARQ